MTPGTTSTLKIWFPVILFAIAACVGMIWYLLFHYPAECARMALQSGGSMTCGLEAGAYVVAGICLLLIVLFAIMLTRWAFKEI